MVYNYDKTDEVGQSILLDNIENKNMNSGLFKLTGTDIIHALVFGIVTGLVSMAMYLMKLGTFFGVDVHTLVNVGGISALGAVVGLIVPFLTTSQGKLLGIVKIK